MSEKLTLRNFLENHKSDGTWTHTSLAGGKYFIGEDDIKTFYDLYTESIMDQEKQYIVEKSTDVGPLRIDFDFIYDRDKASDKHLHTKTQVTKFVEAYINEINKYLDIPSNFDVYIMEKRKPTFDTKKQKIKSGIHIVVPEICTHKFVEQRVRRALLNSMDEYFNGLPLEEPWSKVYDEAVVNRSVPWTVYGSRKTDPNSLPYLVSYIIKHDNGKLSIDEDKPEPSFELMKLLSLRRDDSAATKFTEEGQKIYESLEKNKEVRISGGSAVTPARGRPAQRGDKPGSRGSSPTNRPVLQPLDADREQYLKNHTMNLKDSRFTDYNEWVQVAICLKNIHPDLLDVFLEFSQQIGPKYDEDDCINKWNSLTFRNDGDRLGEGTLRFWSREDNREGYDEIEAENIDRLVLTACSGTEHDVGAVIYAKFRDQYKCVDFGKNIWFRWCGHVWRETDKGVDLQLKLSRQIAKVFRDRHLNVANQMSERNLTECSAEGKKDCGVCEYCQLEKQSNKYNEIYLKLKTTKFKDNVMKECREFFFDEEFTKKVDSNKELIAFNNGVLDLTTFEFRDGKPEDYISFSTNIDYDPEKKYYDYDTWPALDSFICSVLRDPVVRDYFMKHLSTNLMGGNTAQKFHILTGSGSNGKSMILNLTAAALGDYACTVPISLFTQKRKGSGNAAPEVIRLKGRRFVTMQEPDESIALNTGLMKEITSGEKMYARDLFKSGTEFEVQAKFHLACNDKPAINTTDGGTWRRLVVIEFTSKFVPNPKAENELPIDESIQFAVGSKEWATPFLNYLVHILKEGKGLRKLPAPEKVMQYTTEYRNDNDGIARFISEKLVKVSAGDEIIPVDRQTLKSSFVRWKTENDLKTLKIQDMEKRVEALYGKYMHGGWTSFTLVG
jgi:P4 family phage/plasmid primase-like protien